MPTLDVSWVLSSPFFSDKLTVRRTTQAANDKGRADETTETFDITGVVTSDRGDVLDRLPDMRRVAGTIFIHTKFKLLASDDGGDDDDTSRDADIVTWNGNEYTVTDVNDYSRYGAGFVCAKCEPLRTA